MVFATIKTLVEYYVLVTFEGGAPYTGNISDLLLGALAWFLSGIIVQSPTNGMNYSCSVILPRYRRRYQVELRRKREERHPLLRFAFQQIKFLVVIVLHLLAIKYICAEHIVFGWENLTWSNGPLLVCVNVVLGDFLVYWMHRA